MIALFVMVAITQAEPPPLRVALKPGSTCATAIDAAREAADDATEYARYVWIPDWIEQKNGAAQVSLVVNSTLSRTANIVRPASVFGGRLVRIDLDRLAGAERQIPEIVRAWELLAERETIFGVTLAQPEQSVAAEVARELEIGDAVEVRSGEQWRPGKVLGKTPDGKFRIDRDGQIWIMPGDAVRRSLPAASPSSRPRGRRSPSPHLGEPGRRLSEVTGSDVPIIRLDEFVALAFSTINGGQYNGLTGIEADLQKTVAKFAGADAAEKLVRQSATLRRADQQHRKEGGERSIYEIAGELDAELSKSKALVTHSGVTGRQRLALFLSGSAIAPTEGLQLVSVTFDVAEDNADPDGDPQRNLSVYETYNGGEAIFARSNGMLVYVVFDDQDKILASVPDTVAHNYRARQVRPNAATVRVFSGLACAVCHDWDERQLGWQPLSNDMAASLRSVTRFLGDRGSKDRIAEVQRLASAYRADDVQLTELLDGARRQYQRAVMTACGMSSRDVVRGLADSYWGYYYDAVGPAEAVREFGPVLTPDEATAWLLEHVEPEEDDAPLADLVREDIVLARLKEGKTITPTQWRQVYPTTALRVALELAP